MVSLKNFYVLITMERAFSQWRSSGRRCTFGIYCQTLRSIGYKILMFLVILSIPAYADLKIVSADEAVKAIIGEAEGESQTCRIAIAEVIRRRGSLRGIYGVRAERVRHKKYSAEMATLARAAWFDSLNTNYSKDADGFGCLEDVRKWRTQAWYRGHCLIVAVIGKTYFWKRIK